MSRYANDKINDVLKPIAGIGGGGASVAEDVSYDNTTSELEAENVQDALDEIDDQVDTNTSGIQTLMQQTNDMLNVLGAKNLLPNNVVSQTVNGVTFTVHSDGTITANGTATSSSVIRIISAFNLVGGEYILSDEANSTDTNVQMILETPDGAQRFAGCFGTTREFKFTLNQAYTLTSFIWIGSGTTVNNVTFKPMLRLASIQDDTYEPYAKTNRELTTENQTLTNQVTTLNNKVGIVTSKTLVANATSIQFDVPTSGDYIIDFFSSDGSNYTAIDLTVSGKVTLVYGAVASSRTISCRVASA